ncbi:MAG: hypothetical protein SFZ23_14865 [Planctomycetota bacterium]|nr:hypothetical protein [Planctomycetota bacterium]
MRNVFRAARLNTGPKAVGDGMLFDAAPGDRFARERELSTPEAMCSGHQRCDPEEVGGSTGSSTGGAAGVGAGARPSSGRDLARGQLIVRIMELNPSATELYLNQFGLAQLADYARHLEATMGRRGRDSRWVRPDGSRAIVMREAAL